MKTKGQSNFGIGILTTLAITFVVVTVTMSLGGDVLDDFQGDQLATGTDQGCDYSSQVNCTRAGNITQDGLVGSDNISSRFALIGTVAGVAVLIGILVAAFKFRS